MLEEKKITKLFKAGFLPIKGGIELTFKCNLNCVHCYVVRDSGPSELSYKMMCRIIDEIAEAGCIWLHFTGGEPLIRKDFSKIYQYAKKKGLLVKILTNATLLTKEAASLFKDLPPFLVEVSLYGITEKVYENITRVKGSYKKCIKGIELLMKYGIRTEIKTTVLTLNIAELWTMKEWAEKRNLFFKFDPVVKPRIDGNEEVFEYALPPEKVVELDLSTQGARRQLWNREFEASGKTQRNRKYTCDAGRLSFMIDPYGRLMMCKMYPRAPNYNLLSGSFKHGWNILNEKSAQYHKVKGECVNCRVSLFCDRCSAVLKCKSDKKGYLDYYCKVAKLRGRYLLEG